MYLPKHFEQTDPAALQALMREHPLATLIVPGADGITADLIPLEYLPDAGPFGKLRGHVARANPLWKQAGTEVLAVFTGPQVYITPSWYPTKAETHKVVPTWNYTVVQARGPLRAIDDAPWLHALVTGLTAHHEAPRAQPWAVADAPEDYVQTMLRAIVGIEIELTALVGKWKVSQNRNEADRQGVVEGLLVNSTSSTLNSPTPNALAMSRLVAQQ
jgi:transcriptional regulator